MKLSCLVLDSNVFSKLFLDEEDSHVARDLMRFIGKHRLEVMCPDVFLYEVLSIAAQNGFALGKALGLIRAFEKSNLHLTALTERQLQLTMRMAEDGHEKSGYPSIYDSAYHAIALSSQGIFVTADAKHLKKVSKYGSAVHLREWKQDLSPYFETP